MSVRYSPREGGRENEKAQRVISKVKVRLAEIFSSLMCLEIS
jgi:hypothetical protein